MASTSSLILLEMILDALAIYFLEKLRFVGEV